MKDIYKFVYEKLVLNKSSKIIHKDSVKIKPIDPLTLQHFHNVIEDGQKFGKHKEKMAGYMKKGSKPERLVSSIKDNIKLINRWKAAVVLEWDDAIKIFGEAVVDRTNFTLEHLHQYIYYLYKHENSSENWPINYFELYSIDYETN